jgi:TolA-binding protein
MVPEKAAQSARDHIDPPWDDLRSARVQQRVLAELSSPRPAKRTNRTWLALAAAACLAAALVLILRTPSTPASHLEFADGSIAEPTGDAQVMPVLVSDAHIELKHVRGNVRYEVAHRPDRSFLVRAGAVTVRVIGTSFQVNRHDQKVEVRVQRGRVEVTRGGRSVLLTDGEQVVLDDSEVAEPVASADRELPADDTIEVEALPAASDTALPSSVRSAAELFRAADDARGAGNAEGAIQLLGELVRVHPKDPRVTMAVFTMGRLHMQQGRAAQAAQSFESCGNALGGEALAEAALAHASAGNAGRSRTLASQYLERFPEGPRTKEMARLAGR